ncbi:MAG: hypothetical protein KAG95_04790 [Bacteroidales bacterium]|nr:hypothetical protein [Bacteroidales bacterium]
MFKHLTLTFSFILLTISFLFSQDDISLTAKIPKEIQSGNQFTVEVKIKKGGLKGIARFEHKLPEGFVATQMNSANAEFRFYKNTVVLQWINLPFENEFTISYKVKTDTSVEGYHVMRANFYFLHNSERRIVEMYPQVLTINKGNSKSWSAKKDGDLIANNLDNILKKGEFSCIRQKPYINENNEIIVNLLVNKKNLNKFGKIQELIPKGYKAVSVKSNNAMFVYNSRLHIVKFMWMNLPQSPQFVVSYKLIPIKDIPDEAFIITGEMFYAINNVTNTIDIVERGIDLMKYIKKK